MTAGLIIMASQKGPRFQVVRLPGQFTRGRWDCWDYREQEQKVEDAGVLVFESSAPASTATSVAPQASETPATVPITGTHVPNSSPGTGVQVSSTSVSPSTSNFTVGDSSDTIVVTSIAQVQPIASPDAAQTGVTHPPLPPSNSTSNFSVVHQKALSPSYSAAQLPHQVGDIELISQVSKSAGQSNSLTTSSSGKNLHKLGEEDSNNMGLLSAGTNIVAIDNKIEQAMDLVKTHLTFAVREEVETLRTTISDLEAKVSVLEQENQMLRQYAPSELLNNLSNIVQARTLSSVPSSSTSTVTNTTTSLATQPSEAIATQLQTDPGGPSAPATQTHPKLSRTGTAQDLQS